MAKQKTTYYSILGVETTASIQEIKLAYRRLVIQYHPDRIGDTEENREFFFAIQKAYDTLSNESSKAAYDRLLKTGVPSDEDDSGKGFDKVTEALITFEARIISNEGERMSKEEQDIVSTAIALAREYFYETEPPVRGDVDTFAAKLVKRIVATKKEVNRNANIADYLDMFADCVIDKQNAPHYVSVRKKQVRKIIKVAIIAIALGAVALTALHFYRHRNDVPEQAKDNVIESIVQEAIPYEETEQDIKERNKSDVTEGSEGENDRTKEDSILLKDSGIFDY